MTDDFTPAGHRRQLVGQSRIQVQPAAVWIDSRGSNVPPEKPPALNPRLASARAKWERARFHFDRLLAEMKEACGGGDPRVTRTSRRFDAETSEVVWTAEEIVPDIDSNWPLMIGECVYNLRCALDYLWWELTIDHLGREPTAREAPAIQFPILTRAEPGEFEAHRFNRHVAADVVTKAKAAQVYDRPEGAEPYLGLLAELSNHDKHRRIRPTIFRTSNLGLPIGSVRCVDCEVPRSDIGGAEWAVTIGFHDWEQLNVGDDVVRQEVVRTGPRPDIDVEPTVTLEIGFGPHESVLGTLKCLGGVVHHTIKDFAPLLQR
jgi:hypothetical protein